MYLLLSDVSKEFNTSKGPLHVLENINLHVESGELVCVVGASGSGKSTLLRLVAGLDKPTSGQITVGGELVQGPGPERGLVFQHYTLYPWMTVQQNITFGLKLQGVSQIERTETAELYLQLVGLSDFATAYPKELSGGMKQRVAIARALVCQPKILLLDEPFGALDVQTKEIMQLFLLDIWEKTNTTILMITHDVAEAVLLSQRIYVLSRQPGRIKREVTIDLGTYRTYELRQAPKFQAYQVEIGNLIRQTMDTLA